MKIRDFAGVAGAADRAEAVPRLPEPRLVHREMSAPANRRPPAVRQAAIRRAGIAEDVAPPRGVGRFAENPVALVALPVWLSLRVAGAAAVAAAGVAVGAENPVASACPCVLAVRRPASRRSVDLAVLPALRRVVAARCRPAVNLQGS